jgi:hypothetical protein
VKQVLFVNFSDEAFTGYWNSVPETFAPGQSKHMQDWLARHYAKHLANRELLKAGLETHTSPKEKDGKIDDAYFLEYFYKAFIADEAAPERTAVQLETDVLNANAGAPPPTTTKPTAFCDSCDSKGVRHKKECPKNPAKAPSREPKAEDEFPDLNDK